MQSSDTISTHAGYGVRYVIPQRLHPQQDTALFFRVEKPFGAVKFVVSDSNGILATAKRQKAAPGEMEKITLKASLLAKAEGDLTLWVEEDAT